MALRYFKKFSPGTAVIVNGSTRVMFDTLDNVLGYYATDSEAIAQQFEQHMREQRYGMTEIKAEEFVADYVDKKKEGVNRSASWREEMGQKGSVSGSDPISNLPAEKAAAVLGVKTSDIGPRPETTVVSEGEKAPIKPKQQFQPNVGKRMRPPGPPPPNT